MLSRFIRELSKNIALLVNTFNLSHVFLGGHLERCRKEVQTVLAEEIQRNWPYPDGEESTAQISPALGDRGIKAPLSEESPR